MEMILRGASLLGVLGVGVLLLGALGAGSVRPGAVSGFLMREIPALFRYQIDMIVTSFASYSLLGIVASMGFLLVAGSAIGLLTFEIAYHALRMRSLRASWEQSSLYRIIFGEESERTDLYLYLYYCFSLDRFVVASLGLLGPFFIFGLLINGVGLGLAKSWPPLAQFVAYVLLSDFLNYWFHRIAHTAPSLWELHKFHHGATSMNFITAHRNHPMEVAMQLPIRAVPIVVLGPGVHDYLLYTAVHHLVILLQHSNFNVTFGMLERVFVSPRFHLVHHSMKPEHFDKNFGVVFSFWDDLFRTRYTGADSISTYGVTGNYFNRKGFAHDLRVPFVRFGKALFRRGRIV